MIIACGASAGGHLNELLRLLDTEFGQKIHIDIFVTTQRIIERKDTRLNFYLGECNRKTPFRIILVFFRAFFAVFNNQPDLVITTGALPLTIYSYIAKFFGAKIVFIDSIANIYKVSMSGRWAMRFADRIYTQWPELVDESKNLLYKGNLL